MTDEMKVAPYALILKKIDDVLLEIKRTREEVKTERNRRRLSIGLASLAILFSLALGFWNRDITKEQEKEENARQIQYQRDQYDECLQRNEFREGIRSAMSVLIIELVGERTEPEILERADRLNQRFADLLPTVNCEKEATINAGN